MKTFNKPVTLHKHHVIKADPVIVQSILERMQAVITKYQLEVLLRYPDDLLVHDKAMLERFAVSGAKIAWMVGHSHTHLVALGLHPVENLNVVYLTNLSPEDRFFVLKIGQEYGIKMSQIDRPHFAALSATPVPYRRRGDANNFWVYRQNAKLGHVAIKQIGTWQERKSVATITPVAGITAQERAALAVWCSYAITEMAGTLFVRSEIGWSEAIEMAQSGLADVMTREKSCA